MPSSNSFTAVIQSQLSIAIKKVLADMDALGDEGDEFVAAVFQELFPGADMPEAKNEAKPADSEAATGSTNLDAGVRRRWHSGPCNAGSLAS